MLQKIRHKVEKYLRGKGFTSPESRRIMTNQILLASATLLVGAAIWQITAWILVFGVGAAIAAANLWLLARSAHWAVVQNFSTKLALRCFAAFLLRFAGTGTLLYLLLIRAEFPPVPLLAGLFSAIVSLMIIGISRIAGHLD